jgi:hypothetical protein
MRVSELVRRREPWPMKAREGFGGLGHDVCPSCFEKGQGPPEKGGEASDAHHRRLEFIGVSQGALLKGTKPFEQERHGQAFFRSQHHLRFAIGYTFSPSAV